MRKNRTKKILWVLAFIMALCILGLTGTSAYASETVNDGMSLEIVSDKESYSLNDEIKLRFRVTNNCSE